jgi:hypothetical protein
LLLLSPLVLAVVSGGLGAIAVHWGRFRSPVFGLIAGVLLGAFVYGVYWGTGYVDALNQVASSAPNKNDDLIGTINRLLSARASLDNFFLRQNIGQTGIVGYVLYLAEQGLSFSRTSSSSGTEITLNREMTLVYWGLEALFVIGGTALACFRSAQVPFCESGKRWVRERDYQLVGTVDARVSDQFLQVLRSGDYRTAGQYMILGRSMGLLQVQVVMCAEPDLGSPGEMILRVTRSAGNRTNTLLTGVVTPMEYRTFVDNAQQRPPLAVYGR